MASFIRWIKPFGIAWIATFTLASLLHSQYIVNGLVNVGVKVSLMDRLSLSIDDWLGLAPTYGIIIAIGQAIAFWTALRLLKIVRIKFPYIKHARLALFSIAGGMSILVPLLLMQPIKDITLIAGARDIGLYAQIIAGFIGGAIFHLTSAAD